VIWSERRVPVTRRAAAFWTDCNRFSCWSATPNSSEVWPVSIHHTPLHGEYHYIHAPLHGRYQYITLHSVAGFYPARVRKSLALKTFSAAD